MQNIFDFKNVSAKNMQGQHIDDFSLQVSKSQSIALIGTNETGCSLPLYLSNKMLSAESGDVHVFQKNINNYAAHEIFHLRAQLPLIQGEPIFLNNVPMQNNLQLPLLYHTELTTDAIKARLEKAFELFDLQDVGNKLPALFDRTKQKKLAIARAIAMHPGVLLLEQPTWNLRSVDRPLLVKALRSLRKEHQTTLLMATNDFSVAEQVADIVCLFYENKIIACDTPEMIKKEKTKHPKIWGTLEIRAL